MNAHTPPPNLASSELTRLDPMAEILAFDDTMRAGIAFREQRMANRKRERSQRLSAFQSDKKAAKARYEAEIALLDQYIAEEKESADLALKADKTMVAKARAALAEQAE